MAKPLYSVSNWGKYYETSETRKVKRMIWVPVQNKHDGKSYRRIIRRPDGLSILGVFVLILQVASRMEQRGLLKDQDGPLDFQDIADKTGADPEQVRKAMEVLVSEEIGWLSIDTSAEVPAGPAEVPADRPEVSAITGQDITGQDRTQQDSGGAVISRFCANLQFFIEAYPKEVNQVAQQLFLSLVNSQADEDVLFGNLALYRDTDEWKRGMIPAAKNWLSEGSWRVAPKRVAVSGKRTSINDTLDWIDNLGG